MAKFSGENIKQNFFFFEESVVFLGTFRCTAMGVDLYFPLPRNFWGNIRKMTSTRLRQEKEIPIRLVWCLHPFLIERLFQVLVYVRLVLCRICPPECLFR